MRAFPAVSPTNSFDARGRKSVWLGAVLLTVATVVAYADSFAAPFVFEDRPAIAAATNGPVLAAAFAPTVEAVLRGRPLLSLSLALNHAISGKAVWSYHTFNLLVHVLAGLTLFGLVRRTWRQPALERRFAESATWWAGIIAAWWLLHPLQTAAVTYVVQRAESLAGLFVLLTVYGFVRGTERHMARAESERRPGGTAAHLGREQDGHATTRTGNGWLAISVLAGFCGVATKQVAAAAPLLVLFYDRTFVAGSLRAAWRMRRGYYVALAASWLLLAALIASAGAGQAGRGSGGDVSAADYLVTQAHAVVLYLKLALWPAPLVFDYGPRFVVALGDIWPQALLVAGLLAATAELAWRRSVLAFAAIWFFAACAASSGVVPLGTQTIAEHRMYLPLAAVLGLLGAALHRLGGRIALGLGGALAVPLGILTYQRNAVYRSELTLWQHTVAHQPRNVRALHALGVAHSERRDYAQAVPLLERALKLDRTLKCVEAPAVARTRLAHDLLALGRAEEAMPHLEEALRLDPYRAETHYTLGMALRKLERPEIAQRHFREAERLDPSWAEAVREVERLDR